MPTKAITSAKIAKALGIKRKPFASRYKKRGKVTLRRNPVTSTVRIGGGAQVRLRTQPTGFPDRMYMNLVYQSDTIIQSHASGVPAFYQFVLNGLFDPNLTGAGHQPLAYDSVKLLYARYRVTHAKYEIMCVNTSSVLPFNYSYGTNPGTAGPVAATEREAKHYMHGTGGSNNAVVSIKGSTLCYKAASVTRSKYNTDATYSAVIAANPLTTPTLQLWTEPFDQSTTTTVKISINMTYRVVFYEPIYLAQS